MLSFYLIWSSCYLIFLWLLGRTWKVSPWVNSGEVKDFKISVLIPFRNELENLPALVIEIQKIKNSVFEIILIDDHSEDGSADYLEKCFQETDSIKILKSQIIGKKAALSFGISIATGEIIVCTDADCQFNENWIKAICSPFQSKSTQLVAGPVLTNGSGAFFSNFQQIEWASILLLTHYFFIKSSPLMCSGANLAYRKTGFEEVDGYSGNLDQLSGDDEFLLKKFLARFPEGSCVYVNQLDALVTTESQKTWRKLISQRIRWASKWRSHQSLSHTFSAVLAFMIQLVWLCSVVLLFHGIFYSFGFLVVWTMKIWGESFALSRPLKTYQRPQNSINFIGTSLIHPIFVVIVGLVAWRGKFTWKGRSNLRSVILANKS